MRTFLRRLEILNFLQSQQIAVSTDAIVNHLHNSGHLDTHQNKPKSSFRLIQRDLNFLLGDKSDDDSLNNGKENLTYNKFDEHDNDFGLGLEKGAGKALLWKLSPYQQLNYDFERMPAFMALALNLSEKHLKQVLPSETRSELKNSSRMPRISSLKANKNYPLDITNGLANRLNSFNAANVYKQRHLNLRF